MFENFVSGFMNNFAEVLGAGLAWAIGYMCVRNREQILRSVGKIFRSVKASMKYVLLFVLAGIILWGGYEGYKHWMPSGSPTHALVKREDAQTQYQRGLEFHNAKNDVEAVKWYRLAAEQGYNMAQFFLGIMYHHGLGVPQNYSEAAKWYRLAAEQGYAKAQLWLGLMYEYGNGVPQDLTEARKWYQLAANQGNTTAKAALERINTH